ncbi:hypothetical protein ACE7GA_27325 (plasmid) [Roseomonas sp. CCTCC AB2023176]|uniref:hypothetical protein n=1 Tax=Roseomonas sp. CCTCC AB2023176 TaxID=3342640 RepID=UPI0035DDB3E6
MLTRPEASRGAYLQVLVAARGAPRNQVSSLSGLTNTYIRDLERDVIANVPRGNLIALGLALNLGLDELDTLLARFDRAALAEGDIPAFLGLADRLRLSTALHACHNLLYELVVTSLVGPGASRVTIVNQRPTGALRPSGYRTYFDRHVLAAHPLYPALVEAIGAFRRERLEAALAAGCRVEHVLSHAHLTEYAGAPGPRVERRWRRAHVAALADLMRRSPGFSVRLIPTAPTFQYTLAERSGDGAPAVGFEGWPSPGTTRLSPGALTGFATAAPPVVASFAEDLARCRSGAVDGLADRDATLNALEELARQPV